MQIDVYALYLCKVMSEWPAIISHVHSILILLVPGDGDRWAEESHDLGERAHSKVPIVFLASIPLILKEDGHCRNGESRKQQKYLEIVAC